LLLAGQIEVEENNSLPVAKPVFKETHHMTVSRPVESSSILGIFFFSHRLSQSTKKYNSLPVHRMIGEAVGN